MAEATEEATPFADVFGTWNSPGPWRIDPSTSEDDDITVLDARALAVCTVHRGQDGGDIDAQAAHDAQAITHVPTMLQALQEIELAAVEYINQSERGPMGIVTGWKDGLTRCRELARRARWAAEGKTTGGAMG